MTEYAYEGDDFEYALDRSRWASPKRSGGMRATCRHCGECFTSESASVAWRFVVHTENCVLLMAVGDAQQSVRK